MQHGYGLNLVESYLEQNQYRNAVATWEEIKNEPDLSLEPTFIIQLAQAYLTLGNPVQALAIFSWNFKYKSSSQESIAGIKSVIELWFREAKESKTLESALMYCRHAKQTVDRFNEFIKPTDFSDYVLIKPEILYKFGSYLDAARHFDRAMTNSFPIKDKNYLRIFEGYRLLAKKLYQQAIEHFQGIELPLALLGMADAYLALNNIPKALSFYQQCPGPYKHPRLFYTARGWLALTKQDYVRAIECFEKALASNSQTTQFEDAILTAGAQNKPPHLTPAQGLAFAKGYQDWRNKNFAAAAPVFTKNEWLIPLEQIKFLQQYAEDLQGRGFYEKAIAQYQMAQKILESIATSSEEKISTSTTTTAAASIETKDAKEVKEIKNKTANATSATELTILRFNNALGQGKVYLAINDNHTAQKFYEEAVKIQSSSWLAWYHLGVAYQRTKNYKDAIIAYKKALEIDPKNAPTCFNLTCCYLLVNNMAEAKIACEQFNESIAKNSFTTEPSIDLYFEAAGLSILANDLAKLLNNWANQISPRYEKQRGQAMINQQTTVTVACDPIPTQRRLIILEVKRIFAALKDPKTKSDFKGKNICIILDEKHQGLLKNLPSFCHVETQAGKIYLTIPAELEKIRAIKSLEIPQDQKVTTQPLPTSGLAQIMDKQTQTTTQASFNHTPLIPKPDSSIRYAA